MSKCYSKALNEQVNDNTVDIDELKSATEVLPELELKVQTNTDDIADNSQAIAELGGSLTFDSVLDIYQPAALNVPPNTELNTNFLKNLETNPEVIEFNESTQTTTIKKAGAVYFLLESDITSGPGLDTSLTFKIYNRADDTLIDEVEASIPVAQPNYYLNLTTTFNLGAADIPKGIYFTVEAGNNDFVLNSLTLNIRESFSGTLTSANVLAADPILEGGTTQKEINENRYKWTTIIEDFDAGRFNKLDEDSSKIYPIQTFEGFSELRIQIGTLNTMTGQFIVPINPDTGWLYSNQDGWAFTYAIDNSQANPEPKVAKRTVYLEQVGELKVNGISQNEAGEEGTTALQFISIYAR